MDQNRCSNSKLISAPKSNYTELPKSKKQKGTKKVVSSKWKDTIRTKIGTLIVNTNPLLILRLIANQTPSRGKLSGAKWSIAKLASALP